MEKKKVIIKRLETPKMPIGLQFGMANGFIIIDFCTDVEVPPSENEKTSFSTVVLTEVTARKMHEALSVFLKSNKEESKN